MTAEELIDSKYVDFHSLDNGNIWENIENLMITFAKQEVEKALKAASGNARMYSEKDMKQFAWECVANFLSNNDNKVEIALVEVISDRINNNFEKFTHVGEPKQETLDEAAKKNALNELEKYKPNKERFKLSCKNSFLRGAKWEAEQDNNKFSEENIKMCWDAASSYTIGSHIDFKQTHPDFKEWFEKFKNK
jgi:hypothetical protein